MNLYSAAASSKLALKQPTIRVVAIIAEGVPESDTKELISYARSNNKVGKLQITNYDNTFTWLLVILLKNIDESCRLLLVQQLLVEFKLELSRLVTLLEQLITLFNANCTGLDLLDSSPNLYVNMFDHS